ncbi:MAG: hypothetical protein U1E65_06150 [Myxococcota bacterium]
MARASIELIGLALFLGCQGAREPPLTAGIGIKVDTSTGGRTVSLDTTRVPLVDRCSAGELVWMAKDGRWACISPEALVAGLPGTLRPATPVELEAERQAVAAVNAKLDTLSDRLATLDRCGPLPAGQRPPNYVFAAASCLSARAIGINIPDPVVYDGGWLRFRPGAQGEIQVFCPLLPKCDGSDRQWDRLTLRVIDPDGTATDEEVSGTVHDQVNRVPCPTCVASSSSDGTTTEKDVSAGLGGIVPDFTATGFDQARYFLEVRVMSKGGGVAFGGAIIE